MDQASVLPERVRPLFCISLFSSGIILLEILLTRIFSVTLFYHFGFVAISVGLLGLATAGIVVFFERDRLRDTRIGTRLCVDGLLFSGATIGAVLIALSFGAPLKFSTSTVLTIVSLYITCFFPFYFGGKAVADLFNQFPKSFGRIYAYDLAAAGICCFLAPALIRALGAPSAGVAIGGITAIGCLFGIPSASKKLRWIAISLFALAAGLVLADQFFMVLSPVQPKGHIYSKVLYEGWNSFSRVAVYEQSSGPWALGTKYHGPISTGYLLDIDASASTVVMPGSQLKKNGYLLWELTGLAYYPAKKGRGLVIGAGGGRDVVTGLLHGMQHIDAVEINPLIANEVMQKRFAKYSENLYSDPRISLFVEDGRAFIRGSNKKYDLIQLSLVDTWAATAAGAFALSENNLYTVEAIKNYINHLSEDGLITLIRWSGDDILRLVGTFATAAQELGIKDFARHLVLVEAPSSANPGIYVTNLIFRRSEFDGIGLSEIRSESTKAGFHIVYDPEDSRSSKLGLLLKLPNPARRIAASSSVELRPSTDDWPFFFFRPAKNYLGNAFRNPESLFMRPEYLISELLILSILMGSFCLFSPLLKYGDTPRSGFSPALLLGIQYFTGIGLGFMLVELALMQKFVLYLGHPTHSLTTILSGLLIGTGIGSYFASRIDRKDYVAFSCICALLAAIAILISIPIHRALFEATQSQPIAFRIILAEICIVPLGIVFGTLMPLGMKTLVKGRSDFLPWAWALNGMASVCGSCLAVLLSMFYGFTFTLRTAAIIYLIVAALAPVLGSGAKRGPISP